uniref:Elx3 n=1 Tax=Staphylococcus epidermidis TaxID=1282 RepID=I6ZUU5_STAEP|nr:Elx3 [Staphylococcus epidermidis]
MTKILDFLSTACFVLLSSKYAISSINMIFDLKLRWYILEDIPHLSIILLILTLVFFVSSEMIKDNKEKNKK